VTGPHDGRCVFVSGGTTGIGLAAARRFVAEGAKVVVVDLNEAAAAETDWSGRRPSSNHMRARRQA